jgi:CelD/BcsL family acetyltransferase involved in cellulose biosynthesis
MGTATTGGTRDADAGDGSPSGERLECVTDLARFAELRAAWNELAPGNVFLTWDWLDCWWQSYADGAEMRVEVRWDGPELAAGVAFGLRGRHLVAMANTESDLFRPVARSHRDLGPLLREVAEGPWSRITIRGLPADDPSARLLVDSLRSSGWLTDQVLRERCPIIETRGSFEDYSMGLSAKTRANDRRGRRGLERMGPTELRAIEPVDELEPVLAEALALEAAGWKGRSSKAILSSQRQEGFYRSLFERFQRLGRLRLSELRVGGELIAFDLDLLHGDRLYMLKTSYDERYASLSPGNVLLMAMIERAFEDELEAIELLGPASFRKDRYATDARDTVVLRAYRRRPAPVVRYAGRRWAMPRLRPLYVGSRGLIGRLRGRSRRRPEPTGLRAPG